MTRRSRPSTTGATPLANVIGWFTATDRLGSALRAAWRDGRRQRGIADSRSTGAGTVVDRTTPLTISPPGTAAWPCAAFAPRTSSAAGGSPSRRFLPKIANANAIVIAPVVPTSIGRVVRPDGRSIPSVSRAVASAPQPGPAAVVPSAPDRAPPVVELPAADVVVSIDPPPDDPPTGFVAEPSTDGVQPVQPGCPGSPEPPPAPEPP